MTRSIRLAFFFLGAIVAMTSILLWRQAMASLDLERSIEPR